jgi:hypothetical protein
MGDDEPTKVLIGVFGEGMPNVLYIPRGGLKPAEQIFDAERKKREAAAAAAKLQILQSARARGKLTKALKLVFNRRGR